MVKNWQSYLLLLPAFLWVLLFGYITLPYMIIAFQKFSYRTTILTADWVGFKNFEYFFASKKALEVTINTLKLNILFIAFVNLAALLLAIMLNEMRKRLFTRILQSTFLLPHFISWVVVSYIVYLLLATQTGLINRMLISLGAGQVRWYMDASYWTPILVIIRIWKGAGLSTVIFLSAITAIDTQLYEAAVIDGAGKVQQVIFITIPLVLPVVAIITLLAIGRIFYGDFAMIYAIIRDNGLLYPTTDVIDTYVFRALRLTGNPSQAMAAGLYQSLVGFVMVFVSNLFVRKVFPEGALF